jgi:hypothetical protein
MAKIEMLTEVPLHVQLLRIQMLSEALETLISDVWERHQGDRLMTRAAVVPTAELQGDVLIISSRPVALAQASRSESPLARK